MKEPFNLITFTSDDGDDIFATDVMSVCGDVYLQRDDHVCAGGGHLRGAHPPPQHWVRAHLGLHRVRHHAHPLSRLRPQGQPLQQ